MATNYFERFVRSIYFQAFLFTKSKAFVNDKAFVIALFTEGLYNPIAKALTRWFHFVKLFQSFTFKTIYGSGIFINHALNPFTSMLNFMSQK